MTIAAAFAAPSLSVLTDTGLQLTEDEARTASWLATRLFDRRAYLELRGLYYDGLQKMQDLGISIPPSLVGLRTVIGWPRIGVDALSNRCRVEGFRYPGVTDTDSDLWDIWQANNLDGEAQLAHLDALIYGRCYVVVGTGDDSTNGQPLITAESPLNMTGLWDARMRRCTAALQIYIDANYASDMYGQEQATLYLPDVTIQMSRAASPLGTANSLAQWEVIERDQHNLGQVPVVRMANRCRIGNRDGMSEITAEWMNTVDSANRTLLGMEVGREFFAAPRRYVLGASEEAFQRPDGTVVSAWEAYVNRVWALERDENGDIPTVGQFAAGDPATFTKLIDAYSKIMAGEMGVPPHFLGVYSDGNPASADAIRSGYEELTIRATNKHIQFAEAWEETMRLALLIRDGSMPDGAHRMETDWANPAPKTPAATSDAIAKQITAGAIPATSNVTLKELGYSEAQIALLAIDRDKDEAAAILAELAHSLIAKEAKVDQTIATDINPAVKNTSVPPSTTAAMPPGLPDGG